MEIILLLARLVLAGIFGVAGVAKLADREGSRQALTGFGVPGFLTAPLAWGLPAIEILVALLLIPQGTAWFGGMGALALLLIFAGGIGVNLARGNSPDCHCFGQLHSKPVSWPVFTRNLALAAIAGVMVAQGKDHPGWSALDSLSGLSTAEVFSLILSASGMGMFVVTLIYLRKVARQQTALLEKIEAIKKVIDEDYAAPEPVEREDTAPPSEGLPVGALAPDFTLPTLDGKQVALGDLLGAGKPVLLLFVSPSCSPCKALLPMVKVWERDYRDYLTMALLSKGTVKENQQKMAKYEARHLLLQADSQVAEEYQAHWTPAAVLINPDGRIASQVSSGDEAIRALVTHTVTTGAGLAAGHGSNGHIPRITVGNSLFKVGEPAPRFSLPDLRGQEVGLETLLGTPTLLIFWDANCPFCRAMSADIIRWEANPPPGAPQLVFIASGTMDKQREEFRSLMLRDPEFDVAPLFGSQSTPSAVLIDGDGRIASSLATGARNILALAGVRQVELPIAAGF
jgi:methylamine dehydrogenase accessory protein MauD